MKKIFFFAMLLAGFASCSNDVDEDMASPEGSRPALGTLQHNEAAETFLAAANAIDSTVRFTIGDQVVYSGQSVWLANGSYQVNMEFLLNGVWSNLHVAGCTTTGDISMGGLNATTMTVNGSGTLTIMQPGQGNARVEGTIYINQNTAPVFEGVRFTIGEEMFESGDTIWMQKGQYVVNMEFKINGVWSNLHTAQHTTAGEVQMVDYYPPTLEVNGDGSLTIMQAGQGNVNVQGTIYIKAVPQEVDKTVRFNIGDHVVYSGQTLSLKKGSYSIHMEFLLNGAWTNPHVDGGTTTGGIRGGGLNPRTIVVEGDGTVTIAQSGSIPARIGGTVYINAVN